MGFPDCRKTLDKISDKRGTDQEMGGNKGPRRAEKQEGIFKCSDYGITDGRVILSLEWKWSRNNGKPLQEQVTTMKRISR